MGVGDPMAGPRAERGGIMGREDVQRHAGQQLARLHLLGDVRIGNRRLDLRDGQAPNVLADDRLIAVEVQLRDAPPFEVVAAHPHVERPR